MRLLILSFLILSIVSCKIDTIKQKSMVGTYKVSLDLDAQKTGSIKKSVDDAKVEIEKAKNDIKNEVNDENLKEGLSSIVDGVAKIATGAASLGLGLAESIVKLVDIEIELKEDGTIKYNTTGDINFTSNNTKWGIENGKFCFFDNNGNLQQEYELVPKSSKEFQLVNKDLTLIITKIK